MLQVSWNDFKSDSLEFVFNQSSKLLDETFASMRESSTKSYIALAVYTGLLSFCVNEIIKSGEYDSPYMAMAFGTAIALAVLFKNLLPRKMIYCGTEPNKILTPYFVGMDDNLQKREMIITKVINHDEAINKNLTQVERMGDRFLYSSIIFLFSLFLGLVIALV